MKLEAQIIGTGSALWIDEEDIIAPFGSLVRVRYVEPSEHAFVRVVLQHLEPTEDPMMDVYSCLLNKNKFYDFYEITN